MSSPSPAATPDGPAVRETPAAASGGPPVPEAVAATLTPDIPDELVADVFARDCPSRRAMEDVAGKWGILALVALLAGAHRFNALRRRVDGVSEKMLAQTLHTLERDGFVSREVQGTIPPRVEYTLTPLGRRVATRLAELIELVEAELPQILAARARYDAAG